MLTVSAMPTPDLVHVRPRRVPLRGNLGMPSHARRHETGQYRDSLPVRLKHTGPITYSTELAIFFLQWVRRRAILPASIYGTRAGDCGAAASVEVMDGGGRRNGEEQICRMGGPSISNPPSRGQRKQTRSFEKSSFVLTA